VPLSDRKEAVAGLVGGGAAGSDQEEVRRIGPIAQLSGGGRRDLGADATRVAE
jgi:hypothetical protein